MRKLIVLFSMIMILFAVPLFADNWKVVSSINEETLMYNVDSVESVTDNAIIFTIKMSSQPYKIFYVAFDSTDKHGQLTLY